MECSVKKAILHILDNNASVPVVSHCELEIENCDMEEFMSKHIIRIMSDPAAKKAEFVEQESNSILKIIKDFQDGTMSFVEMSIELSNHLFSLMTKHVDIPAADVLICTADIDEKPYLAFLKLNYREGYTHFVENDTKGVKNCLIKHRTILPSESQRVDEGVIICLEGYTIGILEKEYEINGEKRPYLSELYLKCRTGISPKETVKAIQKIAREINQKYYNDSFENLAGLKAAVCEVSQESPAVDIDTIAKGVFKDSHEIQREYVENVRKAGVSEGLAMENVYVERHFKTQKIKTDTGIELNFPSEMFNNKDMLEFINNPDGTISILIKKVNKIINK